MLQATKLTEKLSGFFRFVYSRALYFRDLCKTPPFAQFRRQAQILILKILSVFLRLKLSPSLNLNKIEHFSKVSFLLAKVYFGKNPANVPDNSVVFFPCSENILFCGFAGIVSFKNSKQTGGCVDMALLEDMVNRVESCGYNNCIKNKYVLDADYLGGEKHIDTLLNSVRSLRKCFHLHKDKSPWRQI